MVVLDPNSPVVRLCAAGMQAEGEGRPAEARRCFAEAWRLRRDDLDACIAAHYLARHQPSGEETLRWNQLALDYAEAAGAEALRDFYPSLYLNLGWSHEQLGNAEEARRYYALAAQVAGALPAGRYGDIVRGGAAAGRQRVARREGDPMSSNADMVAYYARRAQEYERIYDKPERQHDLQRLKERLRELLAGERVLEVACGTGYWTQVLAETAASILASDINEEVLEVARSKSMGPAPVELVQADAGALDQLPGEFTAGFAGFWWSHLARQGDLQRFLTAFHARLGPGAHVVFVDNRYVDGSSTPICRIDEHGNTYQLRRLADGSTHEVLKNFPSEVELAHVLAPAVETLQYEPLHHYWLVSYRLRH